MKIKIAILLVMMGWSSFSLSKEPEPASKNQENKSYHFLGAGFYYDYAVFAYDLESTVPVAVSTSPDWFGLGLSYDMLRSNFLFQLNTRISTKYNENKKINVDETKLAYLAGDIDFLFNYLINLGINQRSGIFLGAGIGAGNIYSAGSASVGAANPGDVRVNYSAYSSVIGNIGFMHTIEDINMMWNIVASYRYNSPRYDIGNLDLQDFDSMRVKLGVSYAF